MDQERTWVIVLVKDFESAKQRLAPALDAPTRRELARRNAGLALDAATAAGRVLVVAGGPEAASMARGQEVEVLVEEVPQGQNRAGERGIAHALAGGAEAVLLLSSDLPLITTGTLIAMLEMGARMARPGVLAAPATGRGGTNALYLAPPDVIPLRFGDDSLSKFEREAAARGLHFALHESPALDLDLDQPEDLDLLAARRLRA